MDRRSSLKLVALAPLPFMAGCTWTTDDVEQAQQQAGAAHAAGDTSRQFFTDHEFETAGVLANLIFPADSRSGSATDVGVPAFMDFMMIDRPSLQVPFRGGLAWLDVHARRRFEKPFVEITDAQQRSILDEIAFPEDVAPEVKHGVAFFNRFRDLAASGFWSSKEGMADLRYMGNVGVHKWEGAPQAEMDRLGLTFTDWNVA